MTLSQVEKIVLKLNAHAIEFLKHRGGGDYAKHESAREYLQKAEQTLLNTPDAVFKQANGLIKNKLLAITQNNMG